MAKAKTSKSNPSNGEAKRTGIAAVPPRSASALQKSSEPVSNAKNGDVPLPSPATDTSVYGSVSEEVIRQRAYEIYQQRGGTDGLHEDDWFRAETELLGRSRKSA